jgi:AraC family transcriptional regulator
MLPLEKVQAMLTYSHVSYAETHVEADKRLSDAPYGTRSGKEEMPARVTSERINDRELLADYEARNPSGEALTVTPAEVVARRAMDWEGIGVEIVQCVTHDKVELKCCAPCHLLVAYQEGFREEGETLIDDASRSTLRTLAGKLTFVPAGHAYREWQRPRIRSRLICFYFKPDKMTDCSELGNMAKTFAPRILFENNTMWDAAVKLAAAMEDGAEAERYCEALAIIVAHELLSIHGCCGCRGPSVRGGLAAWQKRIVAAYIQEHLAEQVPIAELAALVDLSCYHFCRAFKQSFGAPPHRYHINRRIERAKTMLANTGLSITEMAIALGFSETSSFSTAFRQATGTAPTEFRRALE